MNKKILVVDDEAHIRHVVSMKLRNAGYEVITATDGEEALELCRAEHPAVVITDFQMPYLSGLEFCKELRRSPETEGIPAIMVTARGFDIETGEMIDAGIADVLEKPFSPRELLRTVNELVSLQGAPTVKEHE